MIVAGQRLPILIATKPVDFRCVHQALALPVQTKLKLDPHSLIGSAKLNGIDPQTWLADVIARISDLPVSRLHKLLPWEWSATTPQVKAA